MIFWISTSFKNKPPNIIQTKKFTNINTRKYRIKENHKIIPKSMQNKILLHIIYIYIYIYQTPKFYAQFSLVILNP